ncbi:MAG: hypothetical protein U0325_35900 [Polyangiales bacterium]
MGVPALSAHAARGDAARLRRRGWWSTSAARSAWKPALGWWTERYGDAGLGYAMIDWVEEMLELTGASLFLFAVLRHHATLPAAPPSDEA